MTKTGGADTLHALPRGLKLRIAIVIERFLPTAGGVENVAWHVAHGLARAGEDVTVVTREWASSQWLSTSTSRALVATPAACPPPSSRALSSPTPDPPAPAPAPPADTDPSALEFLRVPAPRFWQPLRVLAFSRGAQQKTRTDRGFDVVHSFSRTLHQDLYRAGGGSHADYLDRSHSRIGGRIRRLSPRHRVLLEIERRVFADSRQRIQCASRLVADSLTTRHGVAPERILLLPNGVDLERYGSDSARAAGRAFREREAPDAETVWLFPASGWHRKGLDVLLEAWARLARRPTLLWVAGRDAPGGWRQRAARLGVASRVRFLGPRTDLETLYHAADGMVLPTRYDAFANVTLEAAAAGLPIVTTRANGASEWLGEDLTILEDADDAIGLAAALDALAEPARRAALGAAAARRAATLGWAPHVAALRNEYQSIAASRRASGMK